MSYLGDFWLMRRSVFLMVLEFEENRLIFHWNGEVFIWLRVAYFHVFVFCIVL